MRAFTIFIDTNKLSAPVKKFNALTARGFCCVFSKIACYIECLFVGRYFLRIPKSCVRRCAAQAHASDWHTYAILERPWRPHVCVPCDWIAACVPAKSHIFEVGCGSGANLLWLRQQGFSRLSGSDISSPAVHMSQLLAEYVSADLNVSVDDALHPATPPSGVEALLSVNWLYHIPGASLDAFFSLYKKSLAPKGYIAFDVINSTYDRVRNNQYHTEDAHLPVLERRASEYTFRMSVEEVEECAQKHGFVVLRQKKLRSWPPRMAFMVQSAE